MHEPTVADAMTCRVITAVPDTPLREQVATMLDHGPDHGLDTVPVIDPLGHLLGVIADTDILAKLQFRGGTDPPPLLAGSDVAPANAIHCP